MCRTHSTSYALSQYVLYALSQYVLYALRQLCTALDSYALSQYVLYALSQYVLYALSQYVLYALSPQNLHIKESLSVQNSDKSKGNNVTGPSVVNMVEHNNSIRYNNNKGKRKHQNTKTDLNKKSILTCWECEKL
ncbi:hypothetical protein Tco_1208647 [Tanacetum coccineum]